MSVRPDYLTFISRYICVVVDSCELTLNVKFTFSYCVSDQGSKAKRMFTFADYFNDTIRYKKYGVYWVSGTNPFFGMSWHV